MKKVISLLLALSFTAFCFTGCKDKEEPEQTKAPESTTTVANDTTDTDATEATPVKREKIVIAYGTALTAAITAATAQAEGFFDEEGLDVEMVGFSAMPAAIAAMASGDIDFSYCGHGAHALVMSGQAELISMEFLTNGETIIARKDSGITSLADLKGKTFATQFGTSGESLMNVAFEDAGLSNKNVDIINMDMSGCTTAISSGHVDAVCTFGSVTPAILSALGDNAVVLCKTGDYSDQLVSVSSWATLPKTIKERPELVQRFVNALMKASNFRAENLDKCIADAAELLDQDVDTLMLEKDDAKYLDCQDLIDAINNGKLKFWYDSAMQSFLDAGKLTEKADFDSYFDTSFIQKAYETINK